MLQYHDSLEALSCLLKKFTREQLKCILIDCVATLKRYSVEDLCCADMVIVPAGIIEESPSTGQRRPYTEHLSKKAGAGAIPPAPSRKSCIDKDFLHVAKRRIPPNHCTASFSDYSQREAPTIEGKPSVWLLFCPSINTCTHLALARDLGQKYGVGSRDLCRQQGQPAHSRCPSILRSLLF